MKGRESGVLWWGGRRDPIMTGLINQAMRLEFHLNSEGNRAP